MHLNRLCFMLPADIDEIYPPSTDHNHHQSSPNKHEHAHLTHRRRISISIRRSLRHFCNRRWVGFCRCVPDGADDERHLGRRRESMDFQDIAGTDPVGSDEKAGYSNPRIFSYAELYVGSNGFGEKDVLGSGGYGRVYRAVLPSDGTVVAVKCVANPGDHFEKTFAAELAAVAQLRHRNLVRLRGWCVHDCQLLLVYDYMPNSSLDRLLFGSAAAAASGPATLGWERRRRIVAGLAAALFYLHEQLDTQIIHRDVKTSNVMLDSGYNARLGDFGLARWLEHDEELGLEMRSTSVGNNYQFRLTDTSRIGGTIGYLPPESFQKQHAVTAKSDVFSFGIVVLEVATGRRAVDLSYPDDQIILLDWVRRLSDEGKCLNACDNRLADGSYSLSEMRQLIHLGLLCSLHNPQSRPTMKWVMETLSGNYSSRELPPLPSFRSHPHYISLSSSTTTTTITTTTETTTATLSGYVTASNSTIFLTAENSSSGCGSGGSPRRRPPAFPTVDTPREIPFKEILAITNNFSEAHMVAEMDFGSGYHGLLENRIHVLVKRLGMKTCPALRSRFSDELRNLGRLRHRHLVQLRGWCTEQGEMLVVYDYSSRNLLSRHLFCHKSPILSWRHRYGIIKSLASAILYLHEEWDEQVIHRNITSSAIFLDPDKNARLGCFALAEFLTRNEHGHHPVTTGASSVRGIFGYMAPEYVESGEVTPMADVYSFGVVVLEVVSGQMAVDFRWPEVLLVKKVRGFAARTKPLVELADWRLGGQYDRGELMRLVQLGLACTNSDPESRPRMRQIASMLDGNDDLLKVVDWKKEGREEWEVKNASSVCLIKRIQALGIH